MKITRSGRCTRHCECRKKRYSNRIRAEVRLPIQALADIYNWFTEGFDTANLKDARALLDELSA